MKLFDDRAYNRLQGEFQRSMKTLLLEVCDALEGRAFKHGTLSTAFYRHLAAELPDESFRHHKVVGWIEELNDLAYFVDVRDRLEAEPGADTQAEVLAECEAQFYENAYLDDLFPARDARARGLHARVVKLCDRLAQRANQEAALLAPELVAGWLGRSRRAWSVPVLLQQDFERAEPSGALAWGIHGDLRTVPASMLRGRDVVSGTLVHTARGARLTVGTRAGDVETWPTTHAIAVPGHPHFSVGTAVKFGRDKMPRSVMAAPPGVTPRVARALDAIAWAWPQGYATLQRFTSRIIPIQAPGVVSYSLRNRPQLSFINTWHRDALDLVDDLVHENAHHHLNLLLRKYELKRGDDHREIYFSPWRRALRSIHGILHAAFTFTMGARLFERLSTAADKGGFPAETGLTSADLVRARFRALEEVASVRHAVFDLRVAATREKQLSARGSELAELLSAEIEDVARAMKPWRRSVESSVHGKALRQHEALLAEQRAHFTLR